MRILDKNTDFYDYYQNIYIDDTFTFDRRDSYNLSKKEFCDYFYINHYYGFQPKYRIITLQICNCYWVFLLHITEIDSFDKCTDYELKLIDTFKDFTNPRELIKLYTFDYAFYHSTDVDNLNEKEIMKIRNSIIHKDYRHERIFNKFKLFKNNTWEEKHIPILQNIGIASLVDPKDIYLNIDEYFSSEKTSSERTDPIGQTNDDKIVAHGFDTKISFRGKNK